VLIIDEADNMTPDLQKGVLGSIEEYAEHNAVVLTCNELENFNAALLSRCPPVDFGAEIGRDRKKIIKQQLLRACEILTLEGFGFDDSKVALIVAKHFPDFRLILHTLQNDPGAVQ
jgi:DNA polymerase III delta prime subunit